MTIHFLNAGVVIGCLCLVFSRSKTIEMSGLAVAFTCWLILFSGGGR